MVCTVIDSWLNWFVGGCDNLFNTLIVFVVLDYLSDIMCTIADKKRSSKIGFRGIFEKVLIFGFVGISHILDTSVIGVSSALRTTVILFYISTEGGSLLKNAVHLGVPVPEPLKSFFEQTYNKTADEKKTEDAIYSKAEEHK